MDFTALTQSRYSVRKFTADPVPKTLIEQILEVVRNAPTACNKQPQHVYVAASEEARAKIRRSTECHFNAPLFFVVCYHKNESWHRSLDGQDYGMVDAAIVMTQMMLQIHNLQLGSCFVAWFDPAKLRAELQIPENLIPVGILPCGYPAADSAPIGMHTAKKSLAQIAEWI